MDAAAKRRLPIKAAKAPSGRGPAGRAPPEARCEAPKWVPPVARAVPRAPRPALASMVLLALLATGLAGCADEPEDEEDPLLGLCPQWMQGPGSHPIIMDLNTSRNVREMLVFPDNDGQVLGEHQGRSLDLYRLSLAEVEVSGGTLELRAYANATGEQKAIRDYRLTRAQLQPSVRLDGEDAGREFDVALTPITQETAPAPDALRISWRLVGDGQASIRGTVTFHYRVCGADL